MRTETELKPVPEKPAEELPAPKKKKVIKKIKKDDHDDYIQKLIDMEIPKTELEVFEKPEFEDVKKKKTPEGEETETPSKLIVEELPEEVVTLQVPTETGEIVQQKVTTRKIKKKQGDKEHVIEVKTIEEEGKEPETEITIEEVQPSVEDVIPIEESQPILESVDKPEEIVEIEEIQPTEPTKEEQPKTKKKKVVKKPKKDDEDDYIQKLIDQDIPKTELEVFEKLEFEEPKKKPKKKSPKASEEEEPAFEELPEETIQVQLPKKSIPESKPEVEVTEEITIAAPVKKVEQVEDQIAEKIIKKKRRPKETDVEAQIDLEKQPEISTVAEDVETKEIVEPVIEEPTEEISEAVIVQTDEIPEEMVKPIETGGVTPEEPSDKIDDRRTSVSKPKKKIKKKKTSDLDEDYIQKLLDQEIPKTELEKFEKPEFEKPQKKLPEKGELVPIKIERKEQKPTKVKIVPVEEVKPVKVKTKTPKQLEPEVEEKALKPRLKSRITFVDIEKPLTMKITDIGAVRDQGELSRNIEEAEKVLKSKPKKFKHKPKRKDSLERPELEVYEKYESSSDESTKKEPYQRQKKDIPDETTDTKTLKLGTFICFYFEANLI